MDETKMFIDKTWIISLLVAVTWAQDPIPVEVVVVGAGASGLHTAYRLAGKGLTSMVVLEAQNRVGGRVHSVPINNNWIELGAQWIHGEGENPLWKFATQEAKIKISVKTSPAGEGTFVRDDGKEIPSNIMTETKIAISEFRDACHLAGTPANPVSQGNFIKSQFENWLNTEKEDDDQDTRNWRLQFLKWALKIEQFDSAYDDAFKMSANASCTYDEMLPDRNFLNGYQSLFDFYLKSLKEKNVPVLLNTVVKKIKYGNEDGTVLVETENGLVYSAEQVVVSVSLGYLKKHSSEMFEPALPSNTAKAIEVLKIGTTDKIFLEFEKPFWNAAEPGIQFLWSADAGNKVVSPKNWIRQLNGFDGVLQQPNMLEGFMAGPSAREMESLSDKEIAKKVLGQLTMYMRKLEGDSTFTLPALKRIFVSRWSSNPYTLGSYSYRETDSDRLGITFAKLAEPITYNGVPKVFLVGEATVDDYNTAVHGAIQSGEVAAQKILDLQ